MEIENVNPPAPFLYSSMWHTTIYKKDPENFVAKYLWLSSLKTNETVDLPSDHFKGSLSFNLIVCFWTHLSFQIKPYKSNVITQALRHSAYLHSV